MANQTATFGFRHIGQVAGSAPTFEMSVRAIQSTYASLIGFGDPVTRGGTTSAYITVATAGQFATAVLDGIFVGCQYQPTTGGGVVWSRFWPGNAAATDAVAYVIDNPDALFLVATLQTAITSANIGSLVNFTTNGGTTSTVTGNSPMVVDQGTLTVAAANNTTPFRVVGIYGPSFGNFANNSPGQFGGVGNGSDPTSNNNWVIVTFNNQVNYKTGGN